MRTINDMSALGFGCMRLPSDYASAERLILRAVENGVNYFDTAYIYSGNEELLGKIVACNNLRGKIRIATKIPPFLCGSRADFDKIFAKQLARLKTNYIDCYMLHMLNNTEELRGILSLGFAEWVDGKKQSGAIRKIGFSFHGKAAEFTGIINSYSWDFCMIQYNYLDVNTQAGADGLRYAHSKGIPVVIMEPLRGGLLAAPSQMPPKVREIFAEKDSQHYTGAQWALRWLWNHEEISCVLSGMRNERELSDNLAAAESSAPGCMSPEELALIERVAAAYRKNDAIPCTGCNYCMPCPCGVNISGCFAAYNAYMLNKKAFNQYLLATGATVTKRGVASGCVGCGKCEKRCPQAIPVAASLKTVARKMEKWWFRLGMPIARAVTGRRGKKIF